MEFNGLDGFSISSSTRPFHSSQFNAQCHTWPTDSDFSWSQVQVCIKSDFFLFTKDITTYCNFVFFQSDNESGNDKFPSYSGIPFDWPKKQDEYSNANSESNDYSDVELNRPDSGVGESVSVDESSWVIFGLIIITSFNEG